MLPLGHRQAETVDEDDVDFVAYVRQLVREVEGVAAGSLKTPEALAFRTAAEAHFERAGLSQPLARAASAYESSVMHAIATGWSLRFGEASITAVASPSPKILKQLEDADEPVTAAAAIARALARPSRGDQSTKVDSKTLGQDDADRARVLARARRPPKAEFLALFTAGEDVWLDLEQWIRGAGTSAARRRMRESLEQAGVGADFEVEHALARIDYESAFRFAYAFASCEMCLL